MSAGPFSAGLGAGVESESVFDGLPFPAVIAAVGLLGAWQFWIRYGSYVVLRIRRSSAMGAWERAARDCGFELEFDTDPDRVEGAGVVDGFLVRVETKVVEREEDVSSRPERKLETRMSVDSKGAIPYDLTLARMEVSPEMRALGPDPDVHALPDDVLIGGDYDTASRSFSPGAIAAISEAISARGLHVADGEVRLRRDAMVHRFEAVSGVLQAALALGRELRS